MISQLDDYLCHQIAEPVRHLGNSDRNFYDRYYFNVHACSDEFFLILGLGQYPNLGTQDGFAVLRHGDQQTVMRTSRVLGDRFDASCGPLRIEVLEGLKRFHITIAPNESGIEADLIYEGVHVPSPEPRQTDRRHGRLFLDVLRYCQTANYSGWIKLPDGTKISSDMHRLKGYRDRSWGIRAVGEHEPPGIIGSLNPAGSTGQSRAWRWTHIPAQFEDFTLNFKLHEDNDGHRRLEEAVRIWHDGRPREHLGRLELDFFFDADRRYARSARIHCADAPGGAMTVNIRQLLPIYLETGTGYGRSPSLDWTHGQYRGDLVTDVRSYDVTRGDPELFGGIDSVGEFTVGDQTGYGLFEYAIYGRLDKYGFEGPGYWNQAQAR